jgi:hypothetical protein
LEEKKVQPGNKIRMAIKDAVFLSHLEFERKLSLKISDKNNRIMSHRQRWREGAKSVIYYLNGP